MSHDAAPRSSQPPVPPPPPDNENPALIDAATLFKVTVISAALFVGAALFIIFSTRMS